jgi:iron(III) transport system substrate-binding protein
MTARPCPIISSAFAPRLFLAAAIVLGVSIFFTGCPAPRTLEVKTQQGANPNEINVDEAKREGEVVWYTSMSERNAKPIADKFMEQYPFITCHVTRASTFQIVQRIEGEFKTTPRADVLHVLDPAVFVSLEQDGRLYHYLSSYAAKIPTNEQSSGYWSSCRAEVTVLAFRPGDTTPVTSWADLFPKLPPKAIIGLKDAEKSGSAYATYYLLREKYGYSFWDRMKKLQWRIYRTDRDMIAALQRGEVSVLAGVMADSAAKAGLRIVWPTDGAPLVIGPVAILATAPHPNAAKLFEDFLLSERGQTQLRDLTGAYGTLPGLAPPGKLLPLSKVPVLSPKASWDLYTALQPSLQDEYATNFP